jgi:hypothetical protein
VQQALEDLSNIAPGEVQVGGGPGSSYIVNFQGARANQNVAELIATANEIQVVARPFGLNNPFTLTFDGQTTGLIAGNAAALDVQNALLALTNLNPGDLTVTGASGGPWTVNFGGVYVNQNVPQLVVNAAEIQTVSLAGAPTGGTFTLTFAGQTTNPIATDARATTVQAELEALLSIGAGNVLVTGPDGGPWNVHFTGVFASQDVTPLTIGVNEVQTFTLPGNPTSGFFTLTFDSQTTAPLAFDATALDVQLALEALSNIDPGDVAVGFAAGTWTVTFQGQYANQNVAALTGASNEVQLITNAVPGSQMTLRFNGQTTAVLPRDATAAQVQTALENLSNINPGDVLVTGPDGGPYEVTFMGALANQPQPEIAILAPQIMQANSPVITTIAQGGSTQNERQTVNLQDNPVGGVFTLEFNGQLTAPIPFNATAGQVQAALVALNNVAPADVIVTGAGPTWTVEFAGAYSNLNVGQMIGRSNEFQRVVTAAPGVPFSLAFNGQTTATIPANATSAQVQAALEALSNIGVGDVAVTGNPGGPWDVEFRGAFAGQNVAALVVAQDEVQRLVVQPPATGGTFTLTFQGQTTTPLAHNSTAAQVQAALTALSTIGAGNVVVTGNAGGPWDVRFTGVFAQQDVAAITSTNNEIQRVGFRSPATGGTFTLTFRNQTTAPIPFNATAEQVQDALEALGNIADGDVVVTGPPGGAWQVEFRGVYAGQNVSPLVLSTDSLIAGMTEGAYQLQVRLREVDEIGGSAVRFADIRYAENGIRVLGQPTHSPLAGENTETGGNNDVAANAQVLGNLLNADRGVLAVAGDLSSGGDVDWYRMEVRYDATQGTSDEEWWSTIFDIDYADGMGRPNTVIHVFDALTGNLVLSSRDSSVADDRANPLNESDVSDLNRGSSGALDPWIGPAELDEGEYLVAVSGDTFMPAEMQQFFNRNAVNPLFRLEPINSVLRIVEDHIEEDGGSTGSDPIVPNFLNNTGIIPYHLGDVTLYVAQEGPGVANTVMHMVDPFTGEREVQVGNFGFDVGDIAFNPANLNLHAYSLDLDNPHGVFNTRADIDSGHYLSINTGTGAATDLGDDGIETYEPDASGAPVIAHQFGNTRVGYGIQFHAMTFGDASGASGDRARGNNLIAVGNRGESDLSNGGVPVNNFLNRRDNIVYQLDTITGDPIRSGGAHLNGAATSAREVGEIFTSPNIFTVAATSASVNTTIIDIPDTLFFEVDDGTGVTTFEFDSGPELIQQIPLNPPISAGDAHIFDGDFFLLDRDDDWSNGNESMYQFETGISLNVFNGLANPAGIEDGDTFIIQDNQGRSRVFEFDRGTPGGVGPNNISINIGANVDPLTIANNIVLAINGQTSGTFSVSARFLGSRIILFNEGAFTNPNAAGISQETDYGNAPVLQALPGNQIVDGTQFVISIGGLSVTFEFQNDTTDPGNLNDNLGDEYIIVDDLDTSVDVANAMHARILASSLVTVTNTPSRIATDRMILNGPGVTYAQGTSAIVNLVVFYTAAGQFFEINDNPLTAGINDLEETSLAREVGAAVEFAVTNSPTSPFVASAAHQRINFSPAVTGNKIATVQIDVSGVSAWTPNTGAALGVGPTNISIPFLAADTGLQLATRMANAITAALGPTVVATASGNRVRLSQGAVTVPAPLTSAGEGPGGIITGIAIVDSDFVDANNDGIDDEPGNRVDDLFAVSDQGGFYYIEFLDLVGNANFQDSPSFADIGGINSNFLVTTRYVHTSRADMLGIDFQGLTAAPRTVEGSRYVDTFFAIDDGGTLYNINPQGVMLPVFADGATSTETNVTGARGLAFGQLQQNLWHATPTTSACNLERQTDAGHGLLQAFDRSRIPAGGQSSLHFGRGRVTDCTTQNPQDINFHGGAYGTIVSEEFSLEGYSPSDQPVLYFNLFADTENRNVLLPDVPPMMDSFRVFIAGDDGEWELIGTNNSSRGGLPDDDEYDYGTNSGNTSPPRVEEIFDNVNDTWRQIRIDLASYAGQGKLRLRFDYSAAGDMDVGNVRTTGDELRTIEAREITDGDIVNIGAFIFEFELGHSLHLASGNAFIDGQQFQIDVDGAGPIAPDVYEFNRLDDNFVNNGGIQLGVNGQMTAQQVAAVIIGAINANSPGANPIYLGDTEINLPGAQDVVNLDVTIQGVVFVTGDFGVGTTAGTPHVEVAIERDWTRIEVANELNRMMEVTIYDQQIVAVAPFLTSATGATQVIFDGSLFTIENPLDAEPPITFEFDHGYVVNMPTRGGDVSAPAAQRVEDNTTAPGVGTADGFEISVDGGLTFARFEYDIDTPFPELVGPNLPAPNAHRRIVFTSGSSQLGIARATANAINAAGLGITAAVLSGARVQIDTTGNPNVVFRGGQWDSTQVDGFGNLVLQTATNSKYANTLVVPAGGAIVDTTVAPLFGTAEGFAISVGGFAPVHFEFDSDGLLVNNTHTPIPFSPLDTQFDIATAVAAAFNAADFDPGPNVLNIQATVVGNNIQFYTPGRTTFAAGLWDSNIGGGNQLQPTGVGQFLGGINVEGLPGVSGTNQPVLFQPGTGFLASDVADSIEVAIDASPLFGTAFPNINASTGAANGPDQRRVEILGPDITLTFPVGQPIPGMSLELANPNAVIGNNIVKQHEDLIRVINRAVGGSVATGSVTTNASSVSENNTVITHTVPNGSDRLLVVSVATNSLEDVASITYGGQFLTQATERDPSIITGTAVEIWYLVDPPVGTDDIVVNYTRNVDPSVVTATNFTGVDLTNPIGAVGGANATAGTVLSANITTTSPNSLVFGAASAKGGATAPFQPIPAISERWDLATGVDPVTDIGAWGGTMLVAQPGVATFTTTSSLSEDWALALIEINVATTINTAAIGVDNDLEGDIFGAFNSPQRGQANTFEGVYIDDIIIGFAERGEIGTGSVGNTGFVANQLAAGGVTTGSYQLEVRRAREAGVPNLPFIPNLLLLESMHTNDRLQPGRTLDAPSGAEISDGRNFSLSDGIRTLTFEFNDVTIPGGSGVTPGHVQIDFRPDDTASVIAQRVVLAVNSQPVQAVLKIAAQLDDGTPVPTTVLSTTNRVNFIGDISVPNPGSGVSTTGALNNIGEINNGTLIDNDTNAFTVGHFEVQPEAGGSIHNSGVTAQGNASGLMFNEDFIADFLNYIDVGSDGGAIDLASTTVLTPPTLVAPDLVRSNGTFMGANGLVNWTVDVTINDVQEIVSSTIRFDSALPLGNLRFVNYLNQDIGQLSDDLLYQVGTPGQADFRLYTLDNAERVGFSQGGLYQAGPGLDNATYDGWAADRWSELQTAITGPGTSYSILGNIDAGDLPPRVDPVLGIVRGLADVTTAMAWTVDPAATTATITTLLEVVPIDTTGAFNFLTFGEEDGRTSQYGDRNHFRDQGQILLVGNEISHSNQWGILVDNNPRDPADGNAPHQGPVRNLRELNVTDLVPGVVISNNVIHRNEAGGIRFSGDGGIDAVVPFGRIVNNTLYGNGGQLTGGAQTDVGIRIDDRASPTLMNNIIANFNLGVDVAANSNTTVLGGMLFQGNDTHANVALGGPGDFPIVLANTDPLFVNASVGNFYLRAQSRAIDSSVDSLLDRPALETVKAPLGIAVSPIISPIRDGVGQLRVDDPTVATPNGFGLNPFKDRGAIDRVDFIGPNSVLVNPLDNDALGVDLDPAPTVVVLKNQILENFTIRLIDRFNPEGPAEGSDIDDTTVGSAKVRVEVMGSSGPTLLVLGQDYTFAYDSTNNLIRLTPLGGLWPLSRTYRITLDNSVASGIADKAGNILSPNQTDGTHTYTVLLGSAVDWGDAPASFGTLMANNGPNHQIVGGIHLGASNSADPDGQPSAAANLDASDNGVTFGNLQPGGAANTSNVTVVSSSIGKLDAWFDLNQDGDFDANEYLIQGRDLVVGSQLINFTIPGGPRGQTYARFRMSTTGISSPVGPAPDGEVEDYRVTFTGPEFQNGLNVDVNNDGFVSPIDALLVINYLFSFGQLLNNPPFANIPLPPREPEFDAPVPVLDPTGAGISGQGRFIDVNGDGILSPIDANIVITWLNNPPPAPAPLVGEGEGEGESAPAASMAEAAPAGSTTAAAGSSSASSLLSAAPFLVSPDIVFEERVASSTSSEESPILLLDSVEPIDLGLLADATSASEDEVASVLRLSDELDRDLPIGPLDEASWDDLLGELAADRSGASRDPRQSR